MTGLTTELEAEGEEIEGADKVIEVEADGTEAVEKLIRRAAGQIQIVTGEVVIIMAHHASESTKRT